MKWRIVLWIMITSLLTSVPASSFHCASVSSILSAVPNGDFEIGALCTVPDQWVMKTWNRDGSEPIPNATYIHDVCENDTHNFSGNRSCWLHSRVLDTDGTKTSRYSWTWIESKDWVSQPNAAYLRFYVSNIQPSHSLFWGWNCGIYIGFNDSDTHREYDYVVYNNGETLNFNYYNETGTGADGATWYEYIYPIPADINPSQMRLKIYCVAGDWTFYDASYFADMSFYVDYVELIVNATHDIAIANLTCCKTVVGQGINANINVTTENQGTDTETFNVTVYYGNGTFTPEQWNLFWSMGDVNRDGLINQADKDLINASFGSVPGSPRWNPDADINNDSSVDILDAARYAAHSGYSIWKYFGNIIFVPEQWDAFASMGDVNRDGYITMVDVNTIARYFGMSVPPAPSSVDLNHDGKVNILDISICSKGFTQGYTIWKYFLPAIGTQTITNQTDGDSTAPVFTWNTTGLSYGNYSITAVANPVTNETNTANNNVTSWITVTFPGDIDGDFKVNLADLVLLAWAYGSTPSTVSVPPWGWNPNADIDANGVVGLSDLVTLALNFEKQ